MVGNFDVAISIASNSNVIPTTVYGIFTDAASCTRYKCNAADERAFISSTANGAAARMSSPPSLGAIVVPSELNACVRSNRLEAVSGFPSTTTYGLAATCKPVMPAASTINAPKNRGNEADEAAGTNKNAPTAIQSNPVTMVF